MKMNLLGKPKKMKWCTDSKSLKVARTRNNDYEDHIEYEHVSTLIDYNQSYRLNSKVEEFVKLLQAADRFQQYCVLKDNPYTAFEFMYWRMKMEHEKHMDDYFDCIF